MNRSVIIGNEAGVGTSQSTHGFDIFIGDSVGYCNIDGYYNVFMGNNAGHKNTHGDNNLFIGNSSGYYNETSSNNVFLGNGAGHLHSSGDNNIALGFGAAKQARNMSNSVAIGTYAGKISDGESNVFVGNSAGYSNTTGNNNVFVGARAGFSNTTSNKNVFIGTAAGKLLKKGGSNVIIGDSACSVATGTNNTYNNVIIGRLAGMKSYGMSNVIIGDEAGKANENGLANVVMGKSACCSNTSGCYNVAIGATAAFSNTTGDYNVAIGCMAGNSNQTGNSNVFIGNMAGYYETGSNKLYIANSTDNTLIYGEFDNKLVKINGSLLPPESNTSYDLGNSTHRWDGGYIGWVMINSTYNSSYRLNVSGNAYVGGNIVYTGNLTKSSDARLKKEINTINGALDKVLQLRGVTYYWKNREEMATAKGENPDSLTYDYGDNLQIGVIAQELEEVLPELVCTDSQGFKSVDYVGIAPILIEAIKEQQEQIETLKSDKAEMQSQIDELKHMVEELMKKQ